MDNVNLSQANLVRISNQAQNKNTTSPIQPQVQQVEDGENKINKVLVGLGVLGAAAIGIACIARGKKPKSIPTTNDAQKLVKQLQDINFDKGAAKLKDGTMFTGAIEDTLKSGDKVILEYADGVIQKSTKTKNGVEIVKEYTNGVISKKNGETVDIKKVQDEAKSQQVRLKELLANGEITSEEFKKQSDEIKFKSKKQEAEIKKTFDEKVSTEKAEADKLAKEKAKAEAKAKAETEKAAKEAQEKAKIEAQKKAKAEAKREANKEARRAAEVQKTIEHNKRINAQVDAIMKQDDFNEKLEKLLKTKVTINKGRYDSSQVETTIDEVLNASILGEYKNPIDTLYHGTGKTSYEEIMKNGFSFDACNICESGKGIYFGTKQAGAEQYSTGGLIKAKYTGEKIANVKPGTLESLQYGTEVRSLFEDIFGHKFLEGDSDYLNTEILNRIYTKKLSDLGYDAVHSVSLGAGCEYIAILNPNKIQIIK